MGMETCHYDCLDAKLREKNVEVCLEESAVPALWNDVILVR